MNTFIGLAVLTDFGNEFHSFEAEYKKERSNSAVRDRGMAKRPFADDLKKRVWVSDTGFNKLVI